MKTRILLLLLCLAAISLEAQSYTLDPGPSISGAVVLDDYIFLNIDMVNTGSDTIYLQYTLLSNTSNPNWDLSVCDYQSCFPSLPASGAMEPVPVGEHGFLKVAVNPHHDLGQGEIRYRIWESSNPNEADTLTYSFDVVTATQNAAPKPTIAVYPNPASDIIHIETGTAIHGKGAFMLYAADGKLVGIAVMPANGKFSYPVSGLSRGIYLVRVVDRDHDFMARIVVE